MLHSCFLIPSPTLQIKISAWLWKGKITWWNCCEEKKKKRLFFIWISCHGSFSDVQTSAAEEWLKAAYSILSHPKEVKKARKKVSLPTVLNSPTILIENQYLHWADNAQKFTRSHSKCTRKKYTETDLDVVLHKEQLWCLLLLLTVC